MKRVVLRYVTPVVILMAALTCVSVAQELFPINDAGVMDLQQQPPLQKKALCGGFQVSGTIQSTDPVAGYRGYRGGVQPTCASPLTCSVYSSGTFYYDQYVLNVNSPTIQCVDITIVCSNSNSNEMVHCQANANQFLPNSICTNYLGDCGSSVYGNISYTFSVNVPAYSSLVVVVYGVYQTGGNYTLTVGGPDLNPPVITPPPAVVVNNTAGQCGTSASYVALGQATALDDCGDVVALWNDAPTFFPVGTTTVTWYAQDEAGNIGTASQLVTVADIQAPSMWVILWPSFLFPADQKMKTIRCYVGTMDNCPNSTWVLSSVTSNQPDANVFPGDLPNDIGATFNTMQPTFSLRSESAPGQPSRWYTVNFKALDTYGNSSTYSTNVIVQFVPRNVVFSNDGYIPAKMELEQNAPNPVTGSTNITFRLPENANISLRVYDMLGREMAVVTEGDFEAGSHALEFNASSLPEGVYLYKLISGHSVITKKMLVVR